MRSPPPPNLSCDQVYEVTEQAYKNTVARESGYKLLPLPVNDIAVLSGAKVRCAKGTPRSYTVRT
jgi:hypothetical protein